MCFQFKIGETQLDWQKCFFNPDFDVMYFGYTATTKLLAYMKRGGGVLTKNKNFTEDCAASVGGREIKTLGLY